MPCRATDKACDHRRCRKECLARSIIPRIARRGVEISARLGRRRRVVERTFGRFSKVRRLAIRHDRRADIHMAFSKLATAIICMNQIRRFCQALLLRRKVVRDPQGQFPTGLPVRSHTPAVRRDARTDGAPRLTRSHRRRQHVMREQPNASRGSISHGRPDREPRTRCHAGQPGPAPAGGLPSCSRVPRAAAVPQPPTSRQA